MTNAADLTPLGRFMKANGLRDQWLVESLGITQPQASRVRRGKSQPSLETAVAIERVTKGKVRPADLLVAAPCPAAANDDTATERAA